jgi:dynein heavy chain
MYSRQFNPVEMSFKRINFSSATEPINFQQAIESDVERKQARIFVPIGNKNLTVFIDDMSMPFINAWGDVLRLKGLQFELFVCGVVDVFYIFALIQKLDSEQVS